MEDGTSTQAPRQHQLVSVLDQHIIHILKFQPATEAKAALIIVHGMSEHPDRYRHFAEYLSQAGIIVIIYAHRGHGQHPGTLGLGQMSPYKGWSRLLTDLDQVYRWVSEQCHLPIFMLGHSMGSFIAKDYCFSLSPKLSGLILSGSNYQHPLSYRLGRYLAYCERLRLGPTKSSKLLQWATFGRFNQRFKPTKTEYDWLSRDSFQVDVYCEDRLCGFPCSTDFWYQLFAALEQLSSESFLKKGPKTLPIFITGGDQDPLGRFGKGLLALKNVLVTSGYRHVELTLYQGARHEVLNETNQQEVYENIRQWLEGHINVYRQEHAPIQQKYEQQV